MSKRMSDARIAEIQAIREHGHCVAPGSDTMVVGKQEFEAMLDELLREVARARSAEGVGVQIEADSERLAARLHDAEVQVTALEAVVARLRKAIVEALNHDLDPGGWGGPAAKRILELALKKGRT